MANSFQKYKEPKIIKAKRGWFIALYYEYPDKPGKYKRFEISGGVNYIKDLKKREKELQALRKDLISVLKQGFDPFYSEQEEIYENTIAKKELELKSTHWTLTEGFDQYISICKEKQLTSESIKKYQSNINVILNWAKSKEIQHKALIEFTENDILDFLKTVSEEKKWSARSYNNYIDFLSNVFFTMEKMEKRVNGSNVNYNIDFDVFNKKADRSEKNKAFIGRVAEIVKEKLVEYPELNNYIQWIYFSCMRPSEIRDLTIKQIDINNRQIYIEAESGKTGSRIVPISDELYGLIQRLELSKFPHHYYVFGYKSNGAGSKQVSKKYFSELFRKNIRIPLNLSENYTAYGWKHTRVIDLLNAGFTDYEVMSLTGHKGFESFEKYKRDLVIDAKKMKGKTIGF